MAFALTLWLVDIARRVDKNVLVIVLVDKLNDVIWKLDISFG